MSPLFIGEHWSGQVPEWPPAGAGYDEIHAWQEERYPRRGQAGSVADVDLEGVEVVAELWTGRTFTLRVLTREGREIWGDEVRAASVDDVPAVAEARLSGPVAWRVGGEWTRVEDPATGPRWTAPARPVRPDEQ